MDKIKTVSFIGAGNVATHLGKALLSSGITVQQVWSKHGENAIALAQLLHAKPCAHISQLSTEVDLVIVSVKDDVLVSVVEQLPAGIRSLVHTSGSLEMNCLKGHAENIGVFYPLQSFNKNQELSFQKIPVCIEASNDPFSEDLFALGKKISDHVEYVNSTQRLYLHIAAVIANNFTNYMYSVAYDLTTEKSIPFSLLLPLIQNTANRLDTKDPFIHQTGPAQRDDRELIEKHLNILQNNPDLKELYQFISDRIKKKAGN